MRNPRLLTLLRQGCIVHFPSGYLFQPDNESGLIRIGCLNKDGDQDHLGYRSLCERGLEVAMIEQEIYSERLCDDKELALQERKEEM